MQTPKAKAFQADEGVTILFKRQMENEVRIKANSLFSASSDGC